MSEQRGAADAFAEYLAEDAVELENNGDVVRGRSAIAETLRTPSTIRLVLKWKPEAAEASGDLGYTWGRYTLDVTTPEGPSPTRYGKYVTVWRRQRDNVWKVVLDAGNSTPSRAQKP